MGTCASACDTSSKGFKRTVLVITCGIAYQDVLLDSINAYKLYLDDKMYYASCIIALLFVPNILTWWFLRANSMAEVKDLILLMFQLGPISELISSWETGTPSPQLIWFLSAEGLGEAPLTGMLTTYIVAFGGTTSWTFYAGIFSSFLSIAKVATSINFYGVKVSKTEWMMEFMCRVFECASRVLFMGCLAYLMKQPEPDGGENQHNTQTAIFAYLSFHLALNTGMISMVEPKCPISISVFFGSMMITANPLRFLDAFKRMAVPFKIIRYIEMVVMLVLFICPLDPDPRFYDLVEQAPMLVLALVGSFVFSLLANLVATLSLLVCVPQGPGYLQLEEYVSLQDRAGKVQQRLRIAADAGDILMTGLIAKLEGADLNDAVFSLMVFSTFAEPAIENLIEQGMIDKQSAIEQEGLCGQIRAFVDPELNLRCAWFRCDNLLQFGVSTKNLKEAGFFVSELKRFGFPSPVMKEVGWRAEELEQGGYTLAECKQAGFSVSALQQTSYGVEVFKAAGFSLAEMKEVGWRAEELEQAGYTLAECKEAGWRDLKKSGYTLTECIEAGYTVPKIIEAWGVEEFKEIGLDALKKHGCHPSGLRQIGYTMAECAEAGLDLTSGGWSAAEVSGFVEAGYLATLQLKVSTLEWDSEQFNTRDSKCDHYQVKLKVASSTWKTKKFPVKDFSPSNPLSMTLQTAPGSEVQRTGDCAKFAVGGALDMLEVTVIFWEWDDHIEREMRGEEPRWVKLGEENMKIPLECSGFLDNYAP